MNIIVLGGSPKGELSVTLQYVAWMAKRFPQHSFTIKHIAQQINRWVRNEDAFNELMNEIRTADGVLWAFPLYYCLVHGNYKRFIELVFERGAQDAFAGKYVASLTTSIHFFDHTAHNYIHAVSEDLGMYFVDSFPAEMNDLFNPEGREKTTTFATRFFETIEKQAVMPRLYAPLISRDFAYTPGENVQITKPNGKKVVILHDALPEETNLQGMVTRLERAYGGQAEVFNLRDLDIKGGCMGCLKCGYDNHCAYEGKDDYIEFAVQHIHTADVLIFAGTVHDRYLSWLWKTYFDRSFFKTHTPILTGKQLAWVVSGPVSQLANMREVMQAYTELHRANLVGIVSDEFGDAASIDAMLDSLAARTLSAAQADYVKPQSFLGVGGTKLFRDDVWSNLRFVFMADHKAYKKMGIYKTFPQRKWRVRFLNALVAPLLRIRKFREMFQSRMVEQMVAPYQKAMAGWEE